MFVCLWGVCGLCVCRLTVVCCIVEYVCVCVLCVWF